MMNKEQLCFVLEATLLSFDGVSKEKMLEKYGIEERLVNIGIKLSNKLKDIEIKETSK